MKINWQVVTIQKISKSYGCFSTCFVMRNS